MTEQDTPSATLDRDTIAPQERIAVCDALASSIGPKRARQLVDGQATAVVPALSEKQVTETLTAVCQIAAAAEREFEQVRPKRDEVAMSLALFENERGLSTRLGLSRTRFHEMREEALELTEAERKPGPSCSKGKIAKRNCGCEGHWLNNHTPEQVAERAKAKGVKQVPAAFGRRRLDELAEKALRAEERKKVAISLRDEIIRATDPLVWPRERLAGVIVKNVSQISRIRGRATMGEKVPA